MASERPQILVVDGHAIVFRAWFAIPERLATSGGVSTRGAMGFTRMFLNALKQYGPKYAVVTFDPRGPTFRDEMFAEYKAQRPPIDPELHEQIPMVKEILGALKVPVYELAGYEADDVVGTISVRAAEQGVETLILTGDSDQLQLVNSSVKVLMYSGFGAGGGIKEYDEAAVRERYDGLGPEHVVHIKALAGDTSDNIPGVPGVGDKTALALLKRFGDLDGIYKGLADVPGIEGLRGAKRVQALLTEHEKSARDSLALARIVVDAPVEFDLKDAEFGDYDAGEVREALLKYELRTLSREVPEPVGGGGGVAAAAAGAAEQGQGQEQGQMAFAEPVAPPAPDVEVEVVDSAEGLGRLVAAVTAAGRYAFDTETTGLDPLASDLVGVSFSEKAGRGWYVPLGHREGRQLGVDGARGGLADIFGNGRLAAAAHNANFDMMALAGAGLAVPRMEFDTMIAAALCGYRQLGIKQLALKLFNEQMTPIADLIGTGQKQITMAEVEIGRAADYAAADAEVALRLWGLMEDALEKHGQREVFGRIEMPLLPVIVEMQRRGFLMEPRILEGMSAELAEQIDEVFAEVQRRVLGTLDGLEGFNINSGRQIGEVLFERLGAPHKRKTKTGWSVDEDTLDWLLSKEGLDERVYHLCNGVLRHRNLAKLKSTYVDALPRLVNRETGRVHTAFNQVGSATGRLASNNPNIQNIPVRTELGRRVRSAFRADAAGGWELLSADYSQIELRILAHLSGEAGLKAAFRSGEDIHASTARAMYGTLEVSAEQRRIAKILNFGVIYGLGPHGVARQTDLTQKQGREFIDLYFGKYPGIKGYIEDVKARARVNGYVETISGRRRYLPDLRAANQGHRAAAERFAVNMPIQGTAADIAKLAMISMEEGLRGGGLETRMLAQVHDELVFEVAPGEMEELRRLAVERMAGAMELSVPLEVTLKRGPNWGEMRGEGE